MNGLHAPDHARDPASRRSVLSLIVAVATVAASAVSCRRPQTDRASLTLEQALHGHWACTAEFTLGTRADDWDMSGHPERTVIEMDRYIDARAADKTWAEVSGEWSWRTVSQDPTVGEIVVVTWLPTNPKATRERTLRLDASRTTCLELLPSKSGDRIVQRWTFINERSRP